MSDPRGSVQIGETLFFSTLATRQLVQTLAAWQGCAGPSPGNGGDTRIVANLLGAIFRKYEHLLLIADDIGRLTLAEGLYEASPADAMRYEAYVQNSVVLFTSMLDLVARVVAYTGTRDRSDMNRVTWQKLLDRKPPLVNLTDSGEKMYDAAQRASNDLVSFVVDMRNFHQHRGALEVLETKFGQHGEYGSYCRLDLKPVMASYKSRPPAQWLGTFRDAAVQPVRLQHELTADVPRVIESVIGSITWPDCSWAQKTGEDAEYAELRAAGWQRQWWW